MSRELQMSPVQERAERLQRARNLRPAPKREQMFPVNRPAVRRLSAAQERAERAKRARNLRPASEQREQMFPVNRPAVRRLIAAQERAERPNRARNLRPAPKRERVFPGNQTPVPRPARSSRGK